MFVKKTALLSALTTALLASASLQAAETLKAVGAGEGRLDIVAWPGYIERGETDKNYDWVTQFEKDTGCMVNVKTAATSDEMVSLMAKGGYDLVTASGDASLRLVYGKRVQPINPDLIPNWKNLDPRLKNASWYVVDQKTYGTPYQWGPNLLMYNTKTFPKAPDSWSAVFDAQNLPDGKPNKGRVQAYDGPIYVADAALYLKATRPELKINDPYELNEEQYAAVLDLLRKQHSLIHRYWHDTTVQMSDFKNEGVVASSTWPYQANALKAEGQPIATVFPKEGVTGWADTTMLHAEAKHPNCAYKWMDWSLQPKVQGDLAAWFGSVPAVPAGCKASELLGAQGCSVNGYDQFDKIAFWKTPEAKCKTQAQCVPYSRWTQDFIAIMGGR
ncbi:MAG: putative ABC transporter substrate-binding protein YdcS [Pseudomonas sp.]